MGHLYGRQKVLQLGTSSIQVLETTSCIMVKDGKIVASEPDKRHSNRTTMVRDAVAR